MGTVLSAAKLLRRKAKSFLRQITKDGPAQMLPLAYARLNKLDVVQFGVRALILPFRVRTLKLAGGAVPAPDDVIVLSVVRNGMAWLHTFLTHHRELGIRSFVILDNGSTDGTAEFLMAQDDVTLLASNAPYRSYENTFKRYICNRFAKDRWCLFVDIDELVAYPGMAQNSLASLVRFAEGQGFTAVVTQMLDLFCATSLAAMPDSTGQDLRELCRLYETADIERVPYELQAPGPIGRLSGGVRRRLFGTRNGLTKVSLFFNGHEAKPFHHWHHVRNAWVADFSIALLHFPFNRAYREKALEAVESGRYGWFTTDEYKAYAAILRDNPDLSIRSPASRVYEGPEQLVKEGFLHASADFARWARIAAEL